MVDNIPTFDIFSGDIDRDAMWVCAIRGLAAARQKMDEIAAKKPGHYFLFCPRTHAIIAVTETFEKDQRANSGVERVASEAD